MKWEIITAEKQLVSTWSGGDTRELYISPVGSSYTERDFELRLSSATVTSPTSVFTDLSGYNRELVIISGNIRLQHEDAPVIGLQELEKDSFDGGDRTLSWGVCQDFNVMCAKESVCIATARACRNLPEKFAASQEEMFFYAASGNFIWQYGNTTVELHEKALLHICRAEKPFFLRAAVVGYNDKLIQVILKRRYES
jgi:uncharacterized protein